MVFPREPDRKLYSELAEIYDQFYGRIFNYHKFYETINPTLTDKNVKTILEVACGTGRLMKIMEEHGYQVTGLDLNKAMLEIARTRVKGKLIQQDMRSIQLPEKYDSVICLGGSFTYMQSEEDVKNAFLGFSSHLKPCGILIFDNFDRDNYNPQRFDLWNEETHKIGDTVISRLSRNRDWNPTDGTWTIDYTWSITDKHGSRTVTDRHILKSFRYSYLEKKLVEAGFRNIKKIESRQLMISAVKI